MRALLVLLAVVLLTAPGAPLSAEPGRAAPACVTTPVGPLPGVARHDLEGAGAFAEEPRAERRAKAAGSSQGCGAPLPFRARAGAASRAASGLRALPPSSGDRPPALAYLRVNGAANAHGARA